MAYRNEIPTRKTFDTLGSSYTYEQIVDAIETANALNAEFETVYDEVATRMYASFGTHDYLYMSPEQRSTQGQLFILVKSDGIFTEGATKRGGTEFWPVVRIERDIKQMRTQIKKIQKFGNAF